ncbi:TPM domain-containing protein [Leptospira sp. 2 VSF19]|uniref:TPM domain-containing protein n=1 Tax=Leptospira soteropolitanensis TaxID=2950025 RepID=A0AAW5VI86_9LEPT|nr:TPM domain-containing protein [Leptospira soteropolitanensis]MCW7493472.1 TPM domain-containing protein [Leptospira soteropolitanensis]MCW7500996.1 TPM domain-containing protein [Leptospira soteropolitanensis]MCW7523324.1 TPM domain-containing protein [Leptospira soteropolitanensis]MCW7527185.1 TPM domain-containing protein [Leptospira soteropolitanensis]MCW7531042.1 TPM domain-containing protein [Leptospira soteropolitanensis]
MKFNFKFKNSKTLSLLNRRKKYLFLSIFFVTLAEILSYPVPKLERRVMDHAGILSEATVNQIESNLKQFEAETSNQIAVYTTPSLQGETIEDVSIEIFDEWKLGQKSKNNGVLLIIAPNERKMRIAVGRGLEGALTDIQAKHIIRNELKPSFQSGDMDGGVTAGVNAIMATIRGEYAPSEDDVDTTGNNSEEEVFSSGIVGGIFTLISLIVPSIGGMIFTIIGLLVLFPLLTFIFGSTFGLMIAVLLFILVMFLKRKLGIGNGGGSDGGYFGGGGWSSGGDSWSSGSDSWSGGGGDSAGGGSSGDW